MALEAIKAAFQVAQQINNIELQKQLIAAQNEQLEMVERVRTVEDQNAELKKRRAIEESLVFDRNFYWSTEGPEIEHPDDRSGPYCSVCWDDRKTLIHMHRIQGGAVPKGIYAKAARQRMYHLIHGEIKAPSASPIKPRIAVVVEEAGGKIISLREYHKR